MKKKITLYLIFLLMIPIMFAVVTRDIPVWICPDPSSFDVTLKDGGAINSYGVEETIGQDWPIVFSSHAYTTKDSNPNDGIKQIAFFGIPPDQQILYTLVIPSGSYSISGYYALDSSGQKPIGTSDLIVRENTCNKGTEEDLDGDEYGKGCACKGSDCNDNDPEINPGMPEINNNDVDENCDGCIFIDMDDDGYPTSSSCGKRDCNDNKPLINPGMSETKCDEIDNNCVNEACSVNGDCCPSTDVNDVSYYDTDCDCKIDICNPDFIAKYLAGEINPPLQMVIDAIPVCGYSNP